MRLFIATVLATLCSTGAAQDYPAKPIRLVVPFGPGQGADVAARIVAQKLSDNIKQPVVVDNRPGAGGIIGTADVAKSHPDGYTLLVGSNGTHAANPSLYSNLSYNPVEDFEAISYIGSVAMVLISAPAFKATTAQEIISLAKEKPNELNIAVPSSTSQVTLQMLTTTTGAKFNPVRYKTSGTAISDVLGGHVPLSIDTVIATGSQINSGKLRGLAVTTAQRSSVLPNVPTFIESGISDFNISAWNAWFAPQGTPKAIVAKLNVELRNVLQDKDVRTKLQAVGYDPDGTMSPVQVSEFVKAEEAKWGDLIRSGGIKVN